MSCALGHPHHALVVWLEQLHPGRDVDLARQVEPTPASLALQLVRIERLAECLLADQRPVGQFLLPVLEPWQYLAFKEATQALDVGDSWLFAFPD